ncbi:helix-turn-helix domain-containing protein [Streptomyces sp. ISL-10]|uniref:helix-turn-helix domain-containing protein n=1 Tax=Streptomyces sp. ISL-10 TaxID=2819172 RepID=UPI001BE6002E|nr:GAF domain-containing protein [Streptomyces sp. ISL-10]MBT2368690.1 helix-turn-helix domain-containing protein [Streptomyces sp. ISL-10]
MDSLVLDVLEMLALDSPPGRFQDLLDRARRENLPLMSLVELERAVQLALRIQDFSHQRRRRESVMAGLVTTVHDMTVPYDPAALLKVITSRARALLGFDMTYISLRNPEGGSYIHSSDGDTTTLNVRRVLEEGYGLGSLAQEAGAPCWTSDYLNDDRIPHRQHLDSFVRAEGLHAIMAVPIRQDGVPVGVLYAAERIVRHFTPDEISCMQCLADFAAVALEKARILHRSQQENAELASANARGKADIARLRELARASSELGALALGSGDLEESAKIAARALDAALVVSDACGQAFAYAGRVPEFNGELIAQAVLEAHGAGGPVAMGENAWAAPLRAGDELGVVLLQSAQSLGRDELDFLGFVAQMMSLQLVMQDNAAAAQGPLRDEFLGELLTATPQLPPDQLARRAMQLGIDSDKLHVVVAVRLEGDERGKAVAWSSTYAHHRSGLMTVHADDIVLLLPGTDASAAARTVFGELSPLLAEPVTVASAGPAVGLSSVSEVYQEVLRCCDALIALDGVGSAASVDDLGFLGLLLSDNYDVDRFVESVLGPVLAHDAERKTNLVATLEAYFASGNSPRKAASRLYVHRNTVTRRLESIAELLGPGWQHPRQATEAQLALRLLRARDALRRRREAASGAQDTLGT